MDRRVPPFRKELGAMVGGRNPRFGWRWIGRCVLIKRRQASLFVATSSLIYALGLVFPISVQKAVDIIVKGKSDHTLAALLVAVVAATMLEAVLVRVRQAIVIEFATFIDRRIARIAFGHLVRARIDGMLSRGGSSRVASVRDGRHRTARCVPDVSERHPVGAERRRPRASRPGRRRDRWTQRFRQVHFGPRAARLEPGLRGLRGRAPDRERIAERARRGAHRKRAHFVGRPAPAVVDRASRGERSARRLLRRARRLLDAEAAVDLERRLARWGRERLLVLVSYHLAAKRDADLIVVLDQGRVVGTGRHDDLLASAPCYASLWNNYNRKLEMADPIAVRSDTSMRLPPSDQDPCPARRGRP